MTAAQEINYWKISPGKGAKYWKDWKEKDYIAIGWNDINIRGNIKEQVAEKYDNNPDYVKKQFEYFQTQMEIGDIVLVYGNKRILDVGKIESKHYFDSTKENFKHTRKVEWLLDKPIKAHSFGKDFYHKVKHQNTIVPINEAEYIEIIEDEILAHEQKINYFWLNCNSERWQLNDMEAGVEKSYFAFDQNEDYKNSKTACAEAKAGDRVLLYQSKGKEALLGEGVITAGLDSEPEKREEKISLQYEGQLDKISLASLRQVISLEEDITDGLCYLTEEEYRDILALEKVPRVDFSQDLEINDLYFQDKAELKKRINGALENGKHIILTGPPGTGKSKLATEICKSYVDDYQMVTANANWSTFDTIGGYKPNKENQLEFNPGLFLDSFKTENDSFANQWLIIDEINRADIDKAFGPLFSALTGDRITLSSLAQNDKNVVLKPQPEGIDKLLPTLHKYIIPQTWRLIATMNTFDKTSLYEMSYAFMRRFAFIPISMPNQIEAELINEYEACWNLSGINKEKIAALWKEINSVRKIGPAIIKDIYKYLLSSQDDYAGAIIMYVMPQFEGVRAEKINRFIAKLAEDNLINEQEKKQLDKFAADYFSLEF